MKNKPIQDVEWLTRQDIIEQRIKGISTLVSYVDGRLSEYGPCNEHYWDRNRLSTALNLLRDLSELVQA